MRREKERARVETGVLIEMEVVAPHHLSDLAPTIERSVFLAGGEKNTAFCTPVDKLGTCISGQ